jgi:hypothetical protein
MLNEIIRLVVRSMASSDDALARAAAIYTGSRLEVCAAWTPKFNTSNTQPQFFRNVYGTDYKQVVPVNLWRPQQQEISLRTEPMMERNGMIRLVPDRALPPGKYALFYGQSIHSSGMIFNTRLGTQGDTAVYFEIRPATTK